MSEGPPVVDVVLSVHDGLPYLPDQIESIQEQTHRRWRLWVRDDGSTDGTADVVKRFASGDPRIHLHPPDGRRLGRNGVGPPFSWLLERLPDDFRYVMSADADDVWLPEKMERCLAALRNAESRDSDDGQDRAGSEGTPPRPVLVHTDLEVVDAQLRTIHPSFWDYQGIDPEPVTLRRLLVQNVVTAPTVAMNRALVELATPIPEAAHSQDWWLAMVAATFGSVVPLHRATVLYRQHGGNRSGAHGLAEPSTGDLVRRALRLWKRAGKFRADLTSSARQARAFLERYGEALDPEEQRTLREYAEIPDCAFLRRKLRVLRLRTLPEHGMLRNVAAVLRG